jgi:hypothetical protein
LHGNLSRFPAFNNGNEAFSAPLILLPKEVLARMAKRPDEKLEVLTPTEARAGITGHNVRYVLALSIAGTVIAFILAYFLVSGNF